MIQTNFSNLGNSLTAAVVSEGVQSLVYGDDFDFAAVASQSLGYAIGNSLFSPVDAKEQMLEHIELQNGGGRAEAERIYQQNYANRVVSGEDAVFDTLTERQMYELQYGDQADAMMALTESQRVTGSGPSGLLYSESGLDVLFSGNYTTSTDRAIADAMGWVEQARRVLEAMPIAEAKAAVAGQIANSPGAGLMSSGNASPQENYELRSSGNVAVALPAASTPTLLDQGLSVAATVGGYLLDGLSWVNEKTTIDALVDIQNQVQGKLDEWGAAAVLNGENWKIPLYGAPSGFIAAAAPTGLMDVMPGGKAVKYADEAATALKTLEKHVDDVSFPEITHFLDDINTEWRGLEKAVSGGLQDQLGKNVAEKVYLQVKTPTSTHTIVPDNLEQVADGSFIIHEAKFSSVKDLSTYGNLASTFTQNQNPAFKAISDGNAVVTLKNSAGGKALLGPNFQVGKQINVQPTINIYVNTPQGIGIRKYP